jgi:hypothetical protein
VPVDVLLPGRGAEVVGEPSERFRLPEEGGAEAEHVDEVAAMVGHVAALLPVALLRRLRLRQGEPDQGGAGADPLELDRGPTGFAREDEAEPAAHHPVALRRPMVDRQPRQVERQVRADHEATPVIGDREEHLFHELITGAEPISALGRVLG